MDYKFIKKFKPNAFILPEFENKGQYLYYLFNNFGYKELEICISETIDNSMTFSKWLNFGKLLELDPNQWVKGTYRYDKERPYTRDEFIEASSHRRIMDIEVMLDIDEKSFFNSIEHKSKYVFEKLKRLGFNPHVSFTGSKSYHISIIIPELRNHNKRVRQLIKTDILKDFGADLQKSSDRCMISMLGSIHYKSGKIKSEVDL